MLRAGTGNFLGSQHDTRCRIAWGFSVGLKKRHGVWFCNAKPLLHFLADSSKELEELRAAFTRALEYLKQEVEERKWGPSLSACLPFSVAVPFSQVLFVSELLSNFDSFF